MGTRKRVALVKPPPRQTLVPPTVANIRTRVNDLRGAFYKWRRQAMEDYLSLQAGRKTAAEYQAGVDVLLGFARESIAQVQTQMRSLTDTTAPPSFTGASDFDQALGWLDEAARWCDENANRGVPVLDPTMKTLLINGRHFSLGVPAVEVLKVLAKHGAITLQDLRDKSNCDNANIILRKLQGD